MKNKILIGEMAKLHNVSTQTLRYYDKIGLFKPQHIDEENQYRYYDVEQFPMLDSILFFKKLGVSLEEIKAYFHDRDLNKMVDLLKEHEKILKKEINILNRHLKNVREKINIVEYYRDNNNLYTCSFREIESRKVVSYNLKNGGNSVNFEYGLKELYKKVKYDNYIFNSRICSIISKENILNRNYKYLDAVGLLVENANIKEDYIKVLKKGTYATITYTGDDEEKYFNKLMQFIKDNNYNINGDGVMITIIDITFSDYSDEYIKEMQIPVEFNNI